MAKKSRFLDSFRFDSINYALIKCIINNNGLSKNGKKQRGAFSISGIVLYRIYLSVKVASTPISLIPVSLKVFCIVGDSL